MGDQDRASAPTAAERPRAREGSQPASSSAREGAFDPPPERFEERQELGRGGMGRVIEAFDHALGRPVAIKHVLTASEIDVARFAREAQITARLEHPGIVPVHDVGRSDDGTPYYIMRRVDGEPLDRVVAGRPFAERVTRVPNVLAACDAAAFAHARDVIHRDIKPSNILVGSFGETLLIDWGLARTFGEAADAGVGPVSDPSLTRAGVVAGTPGFMAPEQARGEALDARADVYALGATLFFVLAGDLPWATERATEMVDLAGAGRAPDWRRLPAVTPPDLRAIIVKAMASNPGERYPDAGALAADLRRFVTGQLVGAYRYGKFEQLRRFVRRHKAAVGVALAALVVIAVGATISVRRVLAERDDANQARLLAETERLEATRKSDQLLVQNALQYVATHPARAITALRNLPAESAEWPRAAAVAQAAAAQGIPHGFALGSPQVTFDISPDSRLVASMSSHGGAVEILDLRTHARRMVVTIAGARQVRWLDDRTLVVFALEFIRLVDTTTAQVRDVAHPAELLDVHRDRRGGGAWVSTREGTVHRLELTSTELGPAVVDRVQEIDVLDDGRLLVVRDGHIERWSPGSTEVIAGTEGAQTPIVALGGQMAARTHRGLCLWRLDPTPTVVFCGAAGDLGLPVAISNQRIIAASRGGLEVVDATGSWALRKQEASTGIMPMMIATPHGRISMWSDGAIDVTDSRGSVRLGPQGTAYNRVMQSPDERFLVAVTIRGEMLVWDLERTRARAMPIESNEYLFSATDHALWMTDGMRVSRLALPGLERTAWRGGYVTRGYVDRNETWLFAVLQADRKHRLFSLREDWHHALADDEISIIDGTRAYLASSRGEVWRLRDGSKTRELIGTFGASVDHLAVHRDVIAAALADGRLCQVPIGAPVVCTRLPGVTALGVEHGTTVWALVGGALWRWRVGEDPVATQTAQPVRAFVYTDGGLFASMVSSIAMLADGEVKPVRSVTVRELASTAGDRLIAVGSHGRPVAVDARSGITFDLPLPLSTNVILSTDGKTVYATGQSPTTERTELWAWDFEVPTEPEAVRAWLRSVTNALPATDDDLVAWP